MHLALAIDGEVAVVDVSSPGIPIRRCRSRCRHCCQERINTKERAHPEANLGQYRGGDAGHRTAQTGVGRTDNAGAVRDAPLRGDAERRRRFDRRQRIDGDHNAVVRPVVPIVLGEDNGMGSPAPGQRERVDRVLVEAQRTPAATAAAKEASRYSLRPSSAAI